MTESTKHVYGYTMHDGELAHGTCVIGGPTCSGASTSNVCHGEFLCLDALHQHLTALAAEGMSATHGGCLRQTWTEEKP